MLELENELARLQAELEEARTQSRAAVAATHRQYRRDLVPLRQSPVAYTEGGERRRCPSTQNAGRTTPRPPSARPRRTRRRPNNPELTPAHLLDALLAQHETMTRPLLTQVGVDPDALADKVRDQLSRLPRAQGGAEPGLSREARQRAGGGRRDPARPGRRLRLGRAPPAGPGRRNRGHQGRPADRPARRARQPPGDDGRPRADVPGAGQVRPRPHRGGPRRASSTRSSGATRRSAGSFRSCRAAPRTTRC